MQLFYHIDQKLFFDDFLRNRFSIYSTCNDVVTRIQIRSILTKDQKEILKAKHDKMKEKENRRKHRDMDSED
jgi:hypothetical protein